MQGGHQPWLCAETLRRAPRAQDAVAGTSVMLRMVPSSPHSYFKRLLLLVWGGEGPTSGVLAVPALSSHPLLDGPRYLCISPQNTGIFGLQTDLGLVGSCIISSPRCRLAVFNALC